MIGGFHSTVICATEVALSKDHKPNDEVERERWGPTAFAREHSVEIS